MMVRCEGDVFWSSMIRSSHLVRICLWPMNLSVFLFFFFLPSQMGQDGQSGLGWDASILLGRRSGAGFGYNFPPGQLDSDNTLSGQALANQFPLRAGFTKNSLQMCFKWFLFASPCQSVRGCFSSSYYGNMVKFLEINLVTL